MIDFREDILARLLEVVAALPNIRTSYRNNIAISKNQLVAGVVLDGDEQANEAKNRVSNSPVMVTMTPGILIFDQNELVGSEISIMRRELIKGILTDTELNGLIAQSSPRGDGAIRYLGCQTDLGWLEEAHAALAAQFEFKYMLRPDDL